MAVKQLMLRMRLKDKRAALEALRAKDTDFAQRRAALATREAELATSIEEASTDEEKAAVETEGAAIEAEETQLSTDEAAHEDAKKTLTDEIADLERQLADLDANAPTGNPTDNPPAENAERNERTEKRTMIHRAMAMLGATHTERAAFVARQDVKEFLLRLRAFRSESRAVTGGELGIPTVILEMLRDNINRYSKLITRVRLKPVKGKARQNLAGTVPEGIWTEAVGNLNELALAFTQVELDGYKVGGYLVIPNSTIEDSDDIALAAEVLDALGQAVGYGVDKAIPYGTGTKMPVGFITRLAQTAQPSNWGANQGTWTDLHTSNVITLNIDGTTGAAFFASLVEKLGIAAPNYTDGQVTWIMNRKTHLHLQAKALAFDAAAALVAGMQNTMPVVGGDIVELEFMADNEIAGGFLGAYLLAEREGGTFASSDLPLFLQDQTAFKGTARYDGKPVRGEAFVIVSFDNTAPTTTINFAADTANTVKTPTALPVAGTYAGAQSVALACETPGAAIYYTVDGSTPDATKTAYNGPIAVAATATIKAIAIKAGMTNSAVLSATYTISGG